MKKQDFCCLIISGFGGGIQAGTVLRKHLQDSGMDAFLTTPSGKQPLRIEQEHWIHGIRMEYLALRKQYQNIVVIGLSVGGLLLMHLLDLRPKAVVFVNTPGFYAHREQKKELKLIFDADLHPYMHGLFRAPHGRRELIRLVQHTAHGTCTVRCPALILQTKDDRVCHPGNADELYKLLHFGDKTIRLYPEGGHNVLLSHMDLAVCSDIFQFCSRMRGIQE